MFDLVVVGHLTVDEVILPDERRTQAGGAVLYTSVAANKMDLRVGVASKVGQDYPREYLGEMETRGIDISQVEVLRDAPTTRFILNYTGNERRLSLRGHCRPIEPEDLHYLGAKVAHIAPVLDEVPVETVSEISKRCEILSLDPQGYVRQVAEDGEVNPKTWFDPEILSLLNVFKSSTGELQWIVRLENPWDAMERIRRSGPEVVISTWGRKGALMLVDKKRYQVPTFPPAKTLDLTGAGDAFIGGFISQRLQNEDVLWSVSIGAALASYLIETRGCRINASKGEIIERAHWIRERVKEV